METPTWVVVLFNVPLSKVLLDKIPSLLTHLLKLLSCVSQRTRSAVSSTLAEESISYSVRCSLQGFILLLSLTNTRGQRSWGLLTFNMDAHTHPTVELIQTTLTKQWFQSSINATCTYMISSSTDVALTAVPLLKPPWVLTTYAPTLLLGSSLIVWKYILHPPPLGWNNYSLKCVASLYPGVL